MTWPLGCPRNAPGKKCVKPCVRSFTLPRFATNMRTFMVRFWSRAAILIDLEEGQDDRPRLGYVLRGEGFHIPGSLVRPTRCPQSFIHQRGVSNSVIGRLRKPPVKLVQCDCLARC